MAYVLADKKRHLYLMGTGRSKFTMLIEEATMMESKDAAQRHKDSLNDKESLEIVEYEKGSPFLLKNKNQYIGFKKIGKANSGVVKTDKRKNAHVFMCRHEAEMMATRMSNATKGFSPYPLAQELDNEIKGESEPDTNEEEEIEKIMDEPVKHKRIQFKEETRKIVYNNAKGICQICGKYLPYEEMTIDHIMPLAKGGENDIKNLQCTHRKCNLFKVDMLPEDFLEKVTEIYRFQNREKIKKAREERILMLNTIKELRRQNSRAARPLFSKGKRRDKKNGKLLRFRFRPV